MIRIEIRLLLLGLMCSLFAISKADQPLRMGADRMEQVLPLLAGKRVGLIVNHTSFLSDQRTHLLDTLTACGVKVVAVFAPEHGFRGSADAGAHVKDGVDERSGVPIISLYGANRKPTAAQMAKIDVMLFDIQDVGARFYTYISTMFYAMEACAEAKKEFIVLDRPNPCDYIDGPVLEPEFFSFVGIIRVPLLHGATIGELARMIAGEQWMRATKQPCLLTVVPMTGWRHGQPYTLPFKPSPNLPNNKSIELYASLCLFEATTISVGRGTTFPFQVLGAPDSKFGSFTFTPRSLVGFDTAPMHRDKTCFGDDLRSHHVAGFSLRYLIDFAQRGGGLAAITKSRQMFNRLAGTAKLFDQLAEGADETTIRQSWKADLDLYKVTRKKYLLYEEY